MSGFSFAVLFSIYFISVSPFHVRQAAFTLPWRGVKLRGKEIKTRFTKSTFFCAKDCVGLNECSAFNYDATNGTCQLVETDDLFKTEPHPNYQVVVKKLTCKEDSCLNGGTCIDETTSVHDIRNFRCACPCGRCGRRCEKLHFGHIENACIYLFNAGYQKVESPAECMSFCWDTQGCRSADYISQEGACWLNSVTGDEEPLTMDCDKWYPGVAYLFFNCTCEERKDSNQETKIHKLD